MSKIKGQNFRILTEGNFVPEATSCSVTMTGNTEESSTKDTEGLYTQEDVVSTSWQVQVDTFNTNALGISKVLIFFALGAPIVVGWDQTKVSSGTKNREAANASFKRTGKALLTDVSIQFNDRSNVQTTLQYQGTGALQ